MAARGDMLTLLRRVRRLQIQSRKAAEAFMAGQFRSAFKGNGIEFREVRDYQDGDDPGRIDWNVTARFNRLHVKTYDEERDQSVFFLVDGSASTAFGSGDRLKWETMIELFALLSYSATESNDRVGLMLFSDRVNRHLPPRKGGRHALRLIRELLAFEPEQRRTSIATALDYLARVRRQGAVVFLISDFLDQGYERPLKAAAARHDLIAVRVVDPRERQLEGGGLIRVSDLETGQPLEVDLDHPKVRKGYLQAARERDRFLRQQLTGLGADYLELEAAPLRLPMIREFFRRRIKRRIRR